VLLAWSLFSPLAGLVLSLPLLLLLAKSWEAMMQIITLVRERAIYLAAAIVEVDLAPTEVQRLSWWSLRKAGFDCIKLADSLCHPMVNYVAGPGGCSKRGTRSGFPSFADIVGVVTGVHNTKFASRLIAI
jgi:hypothetical protein